MAERPNILLIMTDQHNPHVTGCYGDSVVQTPNLDRLAERGVVFENAYCNYPLCAPSRMCFMTGREPYEIGAWANQSVLPSDMPTFAHALGQTGYEVVDFDDDQVGLILETLSETGLAEDTAVIYTSDHGELAGEHGLWCSTWMRTRRRWWTGQPMGPASRFWRKCWPRF